MASETKELVEHLGFVDTGCLFMGRRVYLRCGLDSISDPTGLTEQQVADRFSHWLNTACDVMYHRGQPGDLL